MFRVLMTLFLIAAGHFLLPAQNFSNGFLFPLPADDSSSQTFLPEFPGEEISDFIGIDPQGHFSG